MVYAVKAIDNLTEELNHRSIEEMLTFLMSQNDLIAKKLSIKIEAEVFMNFYRYYTRIYNIKDSINSLNNMIN